MEEELEKNKEYTLKNNHDMSEITTHVWYKTWLHETLIILDVCIQTISLQEWKMEQTSNKQTKIILTTNTVLDLNDCLTSRIELSGRAHRPIRSLQSGVNFSALSERATVETHWKRRVVVRLLQKTNNRRLWWLETLHDEEFYTYVRF